MQSWLRAGVLAAGIGTALIALPGTAGADDGADRGSVSAGGVAEVAVGLARGHRFHRQDVLGRGDLDDQSRSDPFAARVVVGLGRHVVAHTLAEPVPVKIPPACDYGCRIQHDIAWFERPVDVGSCAIRVVRQCHCRTADDKDGRGLTDALQLGVQVAKQFAGLFGGECPRGHAVRPLRDCRPGRRRCVPAVRSVCAGSRSRSTSREYRRDRTSPWCNTFQRRSTSREAQGPIRGRVR